MPTTTTGISPMHLTLSERTTSLSKPELITDLMRAARKTDWDHVIVRADRAVSVAGAAVVIVALIYFVPIFISMLLR